MYKILLASDGSKHSFKAAEEAYKLASPLQAKITVIAVVQQMSGLPLEINKTLEDNTLEVLEKNKDFFDKKGVEIETLLEHGDPGNIICEVADEGGYDLIIIGSSGLGSIEGLFLGSVSNKVVHSAKTPVMIV
ncbi:MAG: universal stress protein [Firmicutes bacterium]|nr:universal stress protein [Bacillota bacterium]